MLAFFTGFIGGHKLYMGRIGGFIGFMILFVVSLNIGIPISLIAGVMQGIKMLNMSDQEFDKKYNRGMIIQKRGPLEDRRYEQMRRYDQVDEAPQKTILRKPTPTAAMRANPYKNSGIKKYKDFDLEEAIVDFQKGLEITPGDVALNFNIACAYSLTEKKEMAYQHLSRAVAGGLKDVDKILSHDDLAFVRIQPEFDNFRSSGFRENPFMTTQRSEHTSDGKKNIQATSPKNNAPEEPFLDDSLLVQLNKLAELRKKGILSEEEFVFERKKILKQS